MHRTTSLLVAAGLVGAVFATVLGQFVSTPAIAGSQTQAEARTGVVDVLLLLEQMLDTEPYATDRNNEAQGWDGQLAQLEAQINGTVQQLQALDPNNPDPAVAQPLYEQYQSLNQRYSQLQQERGMNLDKFSAGQLAEAYSRIHAAVQVVAEANGVDRVFSSRMTGDDVNADNTNVVVQEVLLRPVIRDVTAMNLTDQVRAELGIPEPTVEEEGPAPEPGAADAPAGGGEGG